MDFFDIIFIAAMIILVIYLYQKKKTGGGTGRQNARGPLPQESGNAYDWWENGRHTPLSVPEMQKIAGEVDAFYMTWLYDTTISHTSIVIWLERDAVKCTCMRRDLESRIPYTHAISCQADRELLADCILRHIRERHPNDGIAAQLYLDGDAIILPTN